MPGNTTNYYGVVFTRTYFTCSLSILVITAVFWLASQRPDRTAEQRKQIRKAAVTLAATWFTVTGLSGLLISLLH
ncbi:hypothetical protein GCM10022248_58170 [Nonomuraea soli]